MKLPNPEEYIKLFSIKETPLLAYLEIEKRKTLFEDEGYPNVEMIYVNSQHFFKKSDIEKYNFDNKKILEIIDLVKKRSNELIKISKDLSNKNCDLNEIKLLLETFGKFMSVVDLPIYLYPQFEERFYFSLSNLKEKEIEILVHPLYNTYHLRRKRDLILVKNNQMSKQDFIDKWNWSEMQLFIKKEVDENFIDEQIKVLKEEEDFDEKEFYDIYSKLNEVQKENVDVAQKLIEIRDYRLECFLKSVYNSINALDQFAKKMNLVYDDIIYMTPIEIYDKKIPSDLNKRKNKFAYYNEIITDEDLIEKLYLNFNKKQNLNFVKGRCAFAGKVTGKVKIVLSNDDLHKVEKNDILVCDITTPDYIHAIHNASAIVANIGGFTSHSAIVAREFNIPCVIGCGNATNIFKDNDLVEVDAEKGIVRKIK